MVPGFVATSSLVMVPVAVPREMVAPVGLDSATVKVSVGSTAVSPMTLTVTVCEVTPPGLNVRVPVLPVKSAPAVAVPLAVAYVTVTGVVADLDRVTVKVAFDVPLLPSATVVSAIEMLGVAGGVLTATPLTFRSVGADASAPGVA